MEAILERSERLKFINENIPDRYKEDIKKIPSLLKKEGSKSIYLFGSLVTGKIRDDSDIDIGIKGLPPEKFFRVYSKLSSTLENKFDLVDFDFSNDLFSFLNSIDEVIEIG
jgi:predicted nucleotidyltransferase